MDTQPNSSISNVLNPIPGIIMFTGNAFENVCMNKELNVLIENAYGFPVLPAFHAHLNGWLSACVISRKGVTNNYYSDKDVLTVLFDGYITEICPALPLTRTESQGAVEVASLYRTYGDNFIGKLRGSFLGLILDHRKNEAFLFNDRNGSRPLFIRGSSEQGFSIAPTTRFLSKINPEINRINTIAVGEFLVRGCFYGEDTIFEGIKKIPQGVMTKITPNSLVPYRYWNLHYKSTSSHNEDLLIEEFDCLLRQATKRLLDTVTKPSLLLSGGFDSRLMLGYLLEQGVTLPSFSYCIENSSGDDHTIAQQVAKLTGLPHEIYPISISDFRAAAIKETLAADGRVQIIDAPSNRWEYIGSKFSSMFIGDECFGWKDHVDSSDSALNSVGWWNIDVAPRISDWIKPAQRKTMQIGIKKLLKQLYSEIDAQTENDLKDTLYYKERMGNMLNGFSARRLSIAEQARPFLDEDIIDFLTQVPNYLRCNKLLARKLMQRKFSNLDSIPYATKTSVPWEDKDFVRIISGNDKLKKFIIDQLTIDLDERLAEIFDTERLYKTATLFFNNEKLPTLYGEWWVHFPGAWRFSKQSHDRVGTLRGLLRVLQLNIFLTH